MGDAGCPERFPLLGCGTPLNAYPTSSSRELPFLLVCAQRLGSFAETLAAQQHKVAVEAIEGSLAVARLVLDVGGAAGARKVSARLGSETLTPTWREEAARRVIDFGREVKIAPEQALQVTVTG